MQQSSSKNTVKYVILIFLGIAVLSSLLRTFTTDHSPSVPPEPSGETDPVRENPSTEAPQSVHEHLYSSEVIPPDCTKSGYTLHICDCGDEYRDEEVPPTGHNLGNAITVTEPTLSSSGRKEIYCSICGKLVKSETIPKLIIRKTVTLSEFDRMMTELPLSVISVNYKVQDERYKNLYPDMLQAILKNNTDLDIKDAVIAFVAWDDNRLPVKIKGDFDFSDGSYLKKVNYSDINLIPGGQYENHSGYEIDENNSISIFKAVVVSFESYGGIKWSNPYFDDWKKLYEGVKLKENAETEIIIKETGIDMNVPFTDYIVDKTAEAALAEKISAQEVRIIKTNYYVQSETLKGLYPDMLQAFIENGSESDIKNAVIAFVAWDTDNFPVRIKSDFDLTDGSFLKKVNFKDINLIPSGIYGNNSGYEIDEDCGIVHFKAFVVSYETFEGELWTNPLFDEWRTLYEGKKLE